MMGWDPLDNERPPYNAPPAWPHSGAINSGALINGPTDWRTGDVLTERTLSLVRNGVRYEVSVSSYDGGRRQQFCSRMGHSLSTDCDHDLGVFGHMQRLLNINGRSRITR